MRTSCPTCDLNPDGRCEECLTLIGAFLGEVLTVQATFREITQEAGRKLEESIRSLTEQFKQKPHQCEDCLRSNGDYTMAAIVRNLSTVSPLKSGLTTELVQSMKVKLASWGITKTPLLDKAWNEAKQK